MAAETTSIAVALGERAYSIEIGEGVLARVGAALAAQGIRRAIVVTNATVAAHWLAPLNASLTASSIATESLLVPDGEMHKTLATLETLLTRLVELRAERSTMLVALGGGVVGDLAGFAAAIYQRGMPFVQVPTSLLAQVDSSVGGKTGVNHPLGKNMIGAFYQPRAVFIDTQCLSTLPDRELSAGLAEVIKCAAIRDLDFFAWLESNLTALLARDAGALKHAIAASCRIKAEIVGADERESGERALLNFGHTFAHAIETAAGYGAWLHGEAVGAGMVLAARLSQRVCGLRAADAERLAQLVTRAGLPIKPPPVPLTRWIELMGRDKKVIAGMMRFVVLEALGRGVVTSAVEDEDLAAVLR
ncbi:MAG: 3-dehydroquinate synthase [Casimicrobiaceae bacterium]